MAYPAAHGRSPKIRENADAARRDLVQDGGDDGTAGHASDRRARRPIPDRRRPMQPSPTSIEMMAETYRRTLQADAERVRAKVPRPAPTLAEPPSTAKWRTALGDLLIRVGLRIGGRPHTAAGTTA
jgi:hypothetical protein